jgi:hypothetical protein
MDGCDISQTNGHYQLGQSGVYNMTGCDVTPADLSLPPAWQGRSAAGPKLRLVEMLAYAEQGNYFDPNSVCFSFKYLFLD